MKKYLVLGIITVLSFGLGNTLLLAADIEAVLDSTDSGSGFVVQDSATTELFRIRGDGNVGIGTTSPAQKLDVSGDIAVSGTVDGRDVAADGTKLDGITSGADVGDITGVTAGTGLTGGGTSGTPTLTIAASPAFTNPTCSTPTSATHIANKAYVDASTPPLYIVTFRYHCHTCSGVGSQPYCPSGWSIVTSWSAAPNGGDYGCIYSAAAGSGYGHAPSNSGCEYNQMMGATETLCLKN